MSHTSDTPGGGGGAPTDADYLVGTANGDLSAEIVVGTSPGGELGGTWASPTVDSTHSGSAHHAQAHTPSDHSQEYLRLADRAFIHSEFVEPVALDGVEGLRRQESGTAAGWTGANGEASHPGVWVAATGSTSTGLARMAGTVAFDVGSGVLRWGVWLQTRANISDATDRFELQVGFSDNDAGASATEAIAIRYRDNVNSGKWQGVCTTGGSSTTLDTGITVATDTWYYLEAEANAGGTSVEFFVDGSSVGTVSTNIPSGAVQPRFSILKSLGTNSRGFDLDAYYVYQEFTTSR